MILLCKTLARNKILTFLNQYTLYILFLTLTYDTKFKKLKVDHKGNSLHAERFHPKKVS